MKTLPDVRPRTVSFLISFCVLVGIALAGCGGNSSNDPADDSVAQADRDVAVGSPDPASEVPPPASQGPAEQDDRHGDAEADPTNATADRALPMPPDPDAAGSDPSGPDGASGPEPWKLDGPLPEEVAARAFDPPPGAAPISEQSRLWIDRKRSRVYVDGYVALKRGALEMFACPVGTKEHESIVAALAKSREVHAALLAIGATPGTPVRFRPEFLPPTGQVIRVFVCWYDADGKFQSVDAREWIQDLRSQRSMDVEWVFAGSGFWQDPEDKREYYRADSGDMICVSNFSSAMMDVAMSSSADTDSLRFVPMEEAIPDRETPVRLVLIPVPDPTDDPDQKVDPELLKMPEATDVPRALPTGVESLSMATRAGEASR